MLTKLLCLFLVCFSSVSCAFHTKQFYTGPRQSKDQVSVVNLACYHVKIHEIDGQKIPMLRRPKYELLPGEHTMKFQYSGRLPFSSPKVVELKFISDPGVNYNCYSKMVKPSKNLLFGYKLFLWLEKNNTREVVAGYYPGKPNIWGTIKNVDFSKGHEW